MHNLWEDAKAALFQMARKKREHKGKPGPQLLSLRGHEAQAGYKVGVRGEPGEAGSIEMHDFAHRRSPFFLSWRSSAHFLSLSFDSVLFLTV